MAILVTSCEITCKDQLELNCYLITKRDVGKERHRQAMVVGAQLNFKQKFIGRS